jgi:predicted nucleic acid-binding protein
VDAAVIGGIRGLSLADAVHLACARAAGATAFVTNDRRIRGSRKLEVVYLDELEPSGA